MEYETVRLDPAGLREVCTELFKAYGLEDEGAATVADCLITADLRGVASHGTVRIKSYLERARKEHWNPRPNIQFEQHGAACSVFGDDGFGALVGTAAMKKAIEIAKEYGVGVCAVRRSSHFGMASYYSLMAAKENMIGFCCTNGVSNLAPYGAMEGMLGTSPFAAAVPVEDKPPVSLDISCSVTARGKISNALREKKEIPTDWALGTDGYPTTDPAEAIKAGALLPMGGHKGSGISIIIDSLCGVLSGGSTAKHVREDPDSGPDVGHFFVALNIEAFRSVEDFKKDSARMCDDLKNAKPRPGVEEVFIPGEQAAKKAEKNLSRGIQIGRGGFAEMLEVCGKYGLEDRLRECLITE